MNTKKIVNQLLLDRGITQTELAEKLGVHRVNLNKVINDRRGSNPIKHKVARFFKKPESYLFPEPKKNASGRQAVRSSKGSGSRPRQK